MCAATLLAVFLRLRSEDMGAGLCLFGHTVQGVWDISSLPRD